MKDSEPFEPLDLSGRMERAVGGLRAPDVVARAMQRGHRQRTRRRLAYGAGSLAVATALALTVPAFAGGWPGSKHDPSGAVVAVDPATTSASPTTAPSGPGGSVYGECGTTSTGWWSKSAAQIRAELSTLLPEAVQIGRTNDDATGTWGGNLLTGDDADFASLTLLPPPGTPGGRRTLQELADGGVCVGGSNKPMQPVKPCDELRGHMACEEIRSGDGALVGVVTERVEQTIVDGRGRPTDKTYVLATVAGPGGGHVELYVAEGTRADRPGTAHDPADVPALTIEQVREIVTDPVWTS